VFLPPIDHSFQRYSKITLFCTEGVEFKLHTSYFSSATENILAKCPNLVDIKKDDGFGALHLAALNGHCDVADILLEKGAADIEIKNNRQQTPLLLSASQGHAAIVDLLVTRGKWLLTS
jgi:ankyrin repeat protein